MDITWQEFEKLVSKLESALFPLGATIKSPDKLKDLVTGELREVDGSIRYKVKDKILLFTIECRKRNQKQDVTWIEQLVTKKKNLNADKTIAVSIKGFSKAAHKLAEQNDITLKSLNEINPVTVVEWLIPKSIVNLFREIKLVTLTTSYQNKGEQIETYLTDKIEDNSFFDQHQKPIPVPMILGYFEDYLSTYRPDVLFSAPLDGSSKKEISLKKSLKQGDLLFKKGPDFFNVTKLFLTIELSYLHTITDLEQGRHYIYDCDKNKFQVTEYDSTNEKLPFTFRHLANTDNGELKSSFEPTKKK